MPRSYSFESVSSPALETAWLSIYMAMIVSQCCSATDIAICFGPAVGTPHTPSDLGPTTFDCGVVQQYLGISPSWPLRPEAGGLSEKFANNESLPQSMTNRGKTTNLARVFVISQRHLGSNLTCRNVHLPFARCSQYAPPRCTFFTSWLRSGRHGLVALVLWPGVRAAQRVDPGLPTDEGAASESKSFSTLELPPRKQRTSRAPCGGALPSDCPISFASTAPASVPFISSRLLELTCPYTGQRTLCSLVSPSSPVAFFPAVTTLFQYHISVWRAPPNRPMLATPERPRRRARNIPSTMGTYNRSCMLLQNLDLFDGFRSEGSPPSRSEALRLGASSADRFRTATTQPYTPFADRNGTLVTTRSSDASASMQRVTQLFTYTTKPPKL
jgi:hypothetical protein